MDEEITIIDSNTRNEKIKNFLLIIKKTYNRIFNYTYYNYWLLFNERYKEQNKIKLANQFNITTINFKTEENKKQLIN